MVHKSYSNHGDPHRTLSIHSPSIQLMMLSLFSFYNSGLLSRQTVGSVDLRCCISGGELKRNRGSLQENVDLRKRQASLSAYRAVRTLF